MPATNSIHQRQPTGLHREKFLLRQLLVSKHFCLTTRRALKRAPRVLGVRVEHEILRMIANQPHLLRSTCQYSLLVCLLRRK